MEELQPLDFLPMLMEGPELFDTAQNRREVSAFWQYESQNLQQFAAHIYQSLMHGANMQLFTNVYTADLALIRDVDRHTRMMLPYGIRRLIMEQIDAAYPDDRIVAPNIPQIYQRTQRHHERQAWTGDFRNFVQNMSPYMYTLCRTTKSLYRKLDAAQMLWREFAQEFTIQDQQMREWTRRLDPTSEVEMDVPWQRHTVNLMKSYINDLKYRFVSLINDLKREAATEAARLGNTHSAAYYLQAIEPLEEPLPRNYSLNVNPPLSIHLGQP